MPISLFLDIINEFWFVDLSYFRTYKRPSIYGGNLGLEFVSSKFVGLKFAQIEYSTNSRSYDYLEPGYKEDIYSFGKRKIRIIFRRGYDYTSLFGPSNLETAHDRLGIFFFRGTSSEGGSNHPWMSDKEVQMLHGEPRVRLIHKLLDALPDGGLIVTDASLGFFGDIPVKLSNDYYPLHEFHDKTDITCQEAYERARPFEDSFGRSFQCIGYAGMKNGPTLIWQIHKNV